MKHAFRKILRKLCCLALCAILFVSTFPGALASDCSLSVSASDGAVGDTLSLSVYASGDVAAATITVTYDPSLVQWTGGGTDNGGSVTFDDEYRSGGGDMSFSASFLAIASGTAYYSVASYDIADSGANTMNVSTDSSYSTISAPVTASSNSLLSSLYVGSGYLYPEFSSHTYEYSLTVEEDVDYLSVSASPDDSAASVYVSGQSLEKGSNVVYISCEAENGDTTTYVIYVTREGAEADASPSPSSSAKPASATLPDGTVREIIDFADSALPKGFTRTTAEYQGIKIDAAALKDSQQLIVYLDGGEKQEDAFWLFDVKTGLAAPMSYVAGSSCTYLPLSLPEEGLPAGYTAGEAAIGDVTWQVLSPTGEKKPNHYLVYALSDKGTVGFYLYDIDEGTFQRYNFAVAATVTASPSPSASPDATATLAPVVTAAPQSDATAKNTPNYLAYILAVALACVLVWAILVTVRLAGQKSRLTAPAKSGASPAADTDDALALSGEYDEASTEDEEDFQQEEDGDAEVASDEAEDSPGFDEISYTLEDILNEYGDEPTDRKDEE